MKEIMKRHPVIVITRGIGILLILVSIILEQEGYGLICYIGVLGSLLQIVGFLDYRDDSFETELLRYLEQKCKMFKNVLFSQHSKTFYLKNAINHTVSVIFIIILLYMGVVMDLPSILGIVISLAGVLTSCKVVNPFLIINSCKLKRFQTIQWYSKFYFYFGKNADSYLILLESYNKSGFILVGCLLLELLFAKYEATRYLLLGCIFPVGAVVLLILSTVYKVFRSNSKFTAASVLWCIPLLLTYLAFIGLLLLYDDSSEFFIAVSLLWGLLGLLIHVYPICVICDRLKSSGDRLLVSGNIEEVQSFQVKTKSNEVYIFRKDFVYLITRNKGDLVLILKDGNYKIISNSEILGAEVIPYKNNLTSN